MADAFTLPFAWFSSLTRLVTVDSLRFWNIPSLSIILSLSVSICAPRAGELASLHASVPRGLRHFPRQSGSEGEPCWAWKDRWLSLPSL